MQYLMHKIELKMIEKTILFLILKFLCENKVGANSESVVLDYNTIMFYECVDSRNYNLILHRHRSALTCDKADFCRLKSKSCRSLNRTSPLAQSVWYHDESGTRIDTEDDSKRVYMDELTGDLIITYAEHADQGTYMEIMANTSINIFKLYHLTVLDDTNTTANLRSPHFLKYDEFLNVNLTNKPQTIVWTSWSSCVCTNFKFMYKHGDCMLRTYVDQDLADVMEKYSGDPVPCFSSLVPEKYRFEPLNAS